MTYTTPETQSVIELPFRLDSVSRIADPQGGTAIWHRYIIIQGSNTITGMRCGTHAEIMTAIEEMVDRLNERFARKAAKAKPRR